MTGPRFTNFRHLLRRFGRGTRAVAAVEFALIMPFMLTLYMGSIEVSQLISLDRKLASVASAVGDLVARSNGEVTTSQIDDYFQVAGLILRPYPSGSMKQLVTFVSIDADGNTNVEWSRGYNGATAKTVDTPYTLPTEITDIATESFVVVSETQITYQPWGGYFFNSSFNLYKQFFHLPRFGEEIELL